MAAGPDIVGDYEEKRSRFLCLLRRVDDESAARALVAEARRTYPDARHHCSAFLVEVPGSTRIERSSDDGEPSGTAGTPMLDVLRGAGLTGVSAVVVRWFGGTKLGTGGLVRAYGAAVAAAVGSARAEGRLVEVHSAPVWTTAVDHTLAGRLESAVRAAGAQVVGVEYGRRVTVRVAAAADVIDPVLAQITSGGARWEPAGTALTERAVES